jgi:hypothetical protein
MAKEDYIQLQIEKLGRFLTVAISKLLGKEGVIESDYIQNTKADLKTDFEFDWNKINELTTEEFIIDLQNNSNFNQINLEYLADLISLIAESESNPERVLQQHSKALAIYIYLNKSDRTYSEERNRKIMKLNSLFES